MRDRRFFRGFGKAAPAVAGLLLALGSATPASAGNLLANGDFTGARWALGPDAGNLVPLPFNFTSHTYLQDSFAWTDSGCDCLDWVANNGSQVIAHAPANPAGYNGNVYVADASPEFAKGTYLMQTLKGLTVGSLYTVSFQQAAGDYYTGADYASGTLSDTAQWIVNWGGSVDYIGNPQDWVLSSDAVSQSSALMHIGSSDGTAPWAKQSLTFRANSTSELLSFLANGSGAPPFALLADVSVTPSVPEPASWAMMLVGMGLIGFLVRRQRARGELPAALTVQG